VKRPRRLVLTALYGMAALAGWVAAELAGLGPLGIESTPVEVSRVTSATARAEQVDAIPRATALPCPILLRGRSQLRRPCCSRR
jgi:hypothetical protein